MNHQVKAAGKEAQSVFVVGPLKEDNHIIKNKEKKKKKKATLWETAPLQTTSKHTQMPKILLCSTCEILSLLSLHVKRVNISLPDRVQKAFPTPGN